MANTHGNKPASDATLREHFAGLAMQAMLSNHEWETENGIMDDALKAADMLLKALEGEP